MLKNRTRAAAAALMSATVLLTACGGGSGGGGDEELTVWMLTLEPTQKEAVEQVVAAYEEANPGSTVTVEERAVDAHKDALRQVAGTNAGPDVYQYWMGPGLGGELVEAGMSRDLSDYYDQYGWADRFSEAAMSNVTQYGGMMGVPWVVQGEGLFYNKELFEQAGITAPPTTYDELVAAADQLVAAGTTPIEFGGTVNWHVMRLLDSLLETGCGAETHDALKAGEADWSAEACVDDAFTELKTWGDEYVNDGFMGISNDESSQLFYTGQAAMALEGAWFNANIAENGMDPSTVGIVPFPTGTGRLYGFAEGFYVNESSDRSDEAAKFLDFATSTDVQQDVVGAFSPLSPNTEVAPATGNPLHELWPPIFDEATGLYLNGDQALSLDATTEYWRIQNSVLTGGLAPADAGAEFQKYLDANA
ncbi:ABC transporter substrate-binding protein [Kineococcus terrestris]|uniref:ABC transporter substrate-binding protein n=1 Tax=Kineococcus terrestris TaxID=2044856 RepID=UPI0034DAD10A